MVFQERETTQARLQFSSQTRAMIISILYVILGNCHWALARWPLDLIETEILYGHWLLPSKAHFISVFLLSQGVFIVAIVTKVHSPRLLTQGTSSSGSHIFNHDEAIHGKTKYIVNPGLRSGTISTRSIVTGK